MGPFLRGRKGPCAGGGLPPWTQDALNIRHVDAGQGNATVILGSDGITLAGGPYACRGWCMQKWVWWPTF